MLQILQLEQLAIILRRMHREAHAMTAQIRVALNARDIADVRRKAKALRARVARRRSNTKVEVDAGTLKSILKVVDAVSSRLPRGGVANHRAKAAKPTIAADEISPQEAAAILQMSRPSVMRLITKGELHPRKVLSHNKLSRTEVVNYQLEQSRQQRQALSNLVTLTEDYDF
jgi:hypothetical protein